MFALVLKDFILLRYLPLWLLVPAVAAGLGVLPRNESQMFLIFVSTMSVFIAIQKSGLREELSRSDTLAALLPVTRLQVVAGRYMTVVLLSLLSTALVVGLTSAILSSAVGPLPLALAFSLPVLFWSVGLPIVFAFGMTRGNTPLLFVMLLPAIASVYMNRHHGALTSVFAPIVTAAVQAPWTYGVGVAAASLVLFALSAALSVEIYSRRDL